MESRITFFIAHSISPFSQQIPDLLMMPPKTKLSLWKVSPLSDLLNWWLSSQSQVILGDLLSPYTPVYPNCVVDTQLPHGSDMTHKCPRQCLYFESLLGGARRTHDTLSTTRSGKSYSSSLPPWSSSVPGSSESESSTPELHSWTCPTLLCFPGKLASLGTHFIFCEMVKFILMWKILVFKLNGTNY